MAAKVGYYLDHPEEREAIAEAGHVRCLQSGNSVDDRVRAVLAKVAELRGDNAPGEAYFAKAVNAP
jgi:spore maturation protein CgeB